MSGMRFTALVLLTVTVSVLASCGDTEEIDGCAPTGPPDALLCPEGCAPASFPRVDEAESCLGPEELVAICRLADEIALGQDPVATCYQRVDDPTVKVISASVDYADSLGLMFARQGWELCPDSSLASLPACSP